MGTTVTIRFEESLLADIDRLAKKEKCSRSELVRQAVRLYIKREDRWNRILAVGKATTQNKRLSERDVAAQVQAHRRSNTFRRG